MGLKDGTKSNRFKRQYKEQWVLKTVQRTMGLKTVQRAIGLKDSTKSNMFTGQYKEQWV